MKTVCHGRCAKGADTMAREYLSNQIDKSRITVYTLNPKRLKQLLPNYNLYGPFKNHEEKDAVMTNASSYDNAYVRPSYIQKQRLEARSIQYDPNRISGTEKNLLRRKNKKIIK